MGIAFILFNVNLLSGHHLILRKKKKEEVLQPDATYIPPTATPSTLSTIQEPQVIHPQAIPSGTLAGTAAAPQLASTPPTEPLPQLPTPQIQPTAQPQPQTQPKTEPELGFQEKMKLLERRLLQGEISEETYIELKEKYAED